MPNATYRDPMDRTKLLFQLPKDMHRDLKVLAGAHEIGVNEFLRQLVAAHVGEVLATTPVASASLRGQLGPSSDGQGAG